MNFQILEALKGVLKTQYQDVIDPDFSQDLYGTIKESIFAIENDPQLDEYTKRELKDHLYDLKRLRNQYAHMAEMPSSEKELLNLLRIKDFLQSFCKIRLNKASLEAVSNLLGLINSEVACTTEPISRKEAMPVVEVDRHSEIACITLEDLSKILSQYEALVVAGSIIKENIMYGLPLCKEMVTKYISDPDWYREMIDYNKVKARSPNEVMADRKKLLSLSDFAVETINGLVDLMDRMNNEQAKEEENEEDSISNIQSTHSKDMEIHEDAIRRSLIKLREQILRETSLPREYCILRKTALERIIRYQIDNDKKLETYIGDLFLDEASRKLQSPYFPEIFKIIKSNGAI